MEYKRQRNYVLALVKKSKKNYFSKIEISSDIKKFWSTCKPYLSKTFISQDQSFFLQRNDGLLITDDSDIAQEFNSYFTNILSTLNISYWKPENYVNVNSVPLDSLFPMYKNHLSILKMKSNLSNNSLFNFKHIEPKEIYETIVKLKKNYI